MNKPNQKETTANKAICVKVTPKEYTKLKNDGDRLNKTVPTLLRETYFNTPPTKVLMADEDVDKIRKEINRIGNNINQIARQINSGLRHGWNSSFESLSEQLKQLNKHYVLNYGLHKG